MPLTNIRKISIGTAPVKILVYEPRRVGITIKNATVGASINVYIGFSGDVLSSGSNVVTLAKGDSMTLLQSDGDDCSKELWAVAAATTAIDTIESVI